MTKSSKMSHRFESFVQQMSRTRMANAALHWNATSSHMASQQTRVDTDISSWFCASVAKWIELDLSGPFENFFRRVKPFTLSLLSVVHNRKAIFEACQILITNASDNEDEDEEDNNDQHNNSITSSSARFEPAMELMAALALDLQSLFLPFFDRFVNNVMEAFSVESPEVIRASSLALAEVLRVLQRQRNKEINNEVDSKTSDEIKDQRSVLSLIKYVIECYGGNSKVLEVSQTFLAHALADVIRRAPTKLANQDQKSKKSNSLLVSDQSALIALVVDLLLSKDQAQKQRRRLSHLAAKILVLASKSQVLKSSKTLKNEKNWNNESNFNRIWANVMEQIQSNLAESALKEQWRTWEILIDTLISLTKEDKVSHFELHKAQLLHFCRDKKLFPLGFKIIKRLLEAPKTNNESKNDNSQTLAVTFVDDILRSEQVAQVETEVLAETLKTCLVSEEQIKSNNLYLLNSLLLKSELEVSEKSKVFAEVVTADARLGAACLSVFRDFVNNINNCSDEALVHLAKGISAVSTSMQLQYNTTFAFEMGHKQRHFLPNSILNAVIKILEEDNNEEVTEINAYLRCLSFLRPLDEQLVEKMVEKGQKALIKRTESSMEHSKSIEINETLNLMYSAASKVFEPKVLLGLINADLVQYVAKSAKIAVLEDEIDEENEARVETSLLTLCLSTLLCISELNCGSSSSVLSFLEDDSLLLSLLSHYEPQVRLHASRLILSLGSISKSSESLIFTALEAEATELDVQSYRDRLRLLEVAKQRILADKETSKLEQKSVDMIIRLMMGNLLSNFAYLRAPIRAMLADLWPNQREIIWEVFQQVMKRLIVHNETMRLRQLLELLHESMMNGLGLDRAAIVVDVFVKNYSGEKMQLHRKLCVAFFNVFARMENVHNIRGFSVLLSSSHSMLTWGLDVSSQLSSLSFLASSFKAVKRVQAELSELTEKSAWKSRLIAITTDKEELDKITQDKRVEGIATRLIVGLLRRSCKLKRQRRRDARRFLLEHCASLSQDFLIGVLKILIENEAINVEMALEVAVVSCSFITIQSYRFQVATYIVELLNKLVSNESKGMDSKLRTKMLNRLISLFNSVPNFLKGDDEENTKNKNIDELKKALYSCLIQVLTWPIEDTKVVPRSIKTSPKMLRLLDLWLIEPKLQDCFLLENEDGISIVESLIKQFLESDKFDHMFVNKIVDRVCSLINVSLQSQDEIKGFDGLLFPLGNHLLQWLGSKRKRKGVKVGSKLIVSSRLSVLKFVFEQKVLNLTKIEVKKIFLDLCYLAPKAIESALAEYFTLFELVLSIFDDINENTTNKNINKSEKNDNDERRNGKRFTPEAAFELLSVVKEMHYKDKLCRLLLSRLGLNSDDHRLSSDPFFLVQTIDNSDRPQVLFALHLFLSHINSLDLGMTTPSVNAILMLLDKIYAHAQEQHAKEIFSIVLRHAKRGLGTREESAFGAAVAILQFLIKSRRLEALSDLEPLLGTEGEEETDFFENVRHLQVHRRTRALRQLARKLGNNNKNNDNSSNNLNENNEENINNDEKGDDKEDTDEVKKMHIDDNVNESKDTDISSLKIGTTNQWQILRPLASRFLFNEMYKENSELLAAATSVLASVATSTGLNGYIRMLEQYIMLDPINKNRKRIKEKNEEQDNSGNKKPFMKQKFNMVSMLLDRFTFAANLADDATKIRLRAIVRKLLRQTRSNNSAEGQSNESHFTVYVAIVHFVVKHFDDQDPIRGCLNTVIIDLANKLKSREFRYRESVRSVLVRTIQTLGPTYLQHLFTVLQTTLTKGFQIHVLIDVYAKVLDQMKSAMNAEDADDLLPIVLHFCSLELYSDLCSEKRIKLIRKRTPEASKTHTYAIVQHLASIVSNDSDTLKSMLHPFLFIPGQITLDKLEKSRNALRSIIAGLTSNKKFDETQHLLVVAYAAMEDKLYDSSQINVASNVAEVQRQLQREFAFALVLSAIRRTQNFDFNSMQLFITESIKSVERKETQVLHDALRVLNMSVHNKQVLKSMHESRLSHEVVKVIVTNLKKLCGAKLKEHFNLCASIIGALLREPSKLELFTPTLARAVKSFFLASLETNTTRDDLTTPKMLISVLRHIPIKENRPLVLRLCRMYIEADVGPAVVKQLQHLLMASNDEVAKVSLEFMLDNVDYDDIEGRRRVAQYIADAVVNKSASNGFKLHPSLLSRAFFLVTNASVKEEATALQHLFKTTMGAIMMRHFNNEVDLNLSVIDVLAKWAESNKMVQKLVAVKVALITAELADKGNCESVAKFCVRIVANVGVEFGIEIRTNDDDKKSKKKKKGKSNNIEENEDQEEDGDQKSKNMNGSNDSNTVANAALKAHVLSLVTHLLSMSHWLPRTNEFATNFITKNKERLIDTILHPNAGLRLKVLNLWHKVLTQAVNEPKFWLAINNDAKNASRRKRKHLETKEVWPKRLIANVFEILNHWLEETVITSEPTILTDILLCLLHIDYGNYVQEVMRRSRLAIKQEKNERPQDRSRRRALLKLMDHVINSGEFGVDVAMVESVLAVATRNKGTEAGVQLMQRCEKRMGVEAYTKLVAKVAQNRAEGAKKRRAREDEEKVVKKKKKKKRNVEVVSD